MTRPALPGPIKINEPETCILVPYKEGEGVRDGANYQGPDSLERYVKS